MPRHQATLIRRAPGCLWAKAGSRLAAGLNESTGKADMKTEIVLDRQAKGAERAPVTLESLIENARQILDLAIAEKQFSAAVAALQEIGTLAGLRIERREVGQPGEFELLCADLRH
jgi:hypothetical protein